MQNRFTGWMDVGLSEKGKDEAKKAGQLLNNYKFDCIFVSHLRRAIQTMELILEASHDKRTPLLYHEEDMVMRSWEHHTGNESEELSIFQTKLLAERYYGDLQGLNKADTAKKYGDEQVHIWRRSFDVNPPNGESLKDTISRVQPYFESKIIPELKSNKTILICAHGNSLRALVKYLEKISDNDIPNLEIPTGIPIEYELDSELNVIEKKELK